MGRQQQQMLVGTPLSSITEALYDGTAAGIHRIMPTLPHTHYIVRTPSTTGLTGRDYTLYDGSGGQLNAAPPCFCSTVMTPFMMLAWGTQ